MLLTYETGLDFLHQTRKYPCFVRSAFAREAQMGQEPYLRLGIVDLTLISSNDLKLSLLNSIPILGTIRGLARLYSVWSVKDRSKDRVKDLVTHTFLGIFETLGLGVGLLVMKIVITALIRIAFLILVLFAALYQFTRTKVQQLSCFSE
ncbi:hypothetical protein [Chlamydia caviae]|uniref:Uncharacterized protein n=1 Tax=Chlamydia caviae (strain ATCC VR-813 / DSM 19441 / 03DC25 / GPIC) TaxID=227941 RepID=Q822V0_CHLCV|nr:hypothetical protein [Chlamydia caviae]AAP05321.1 conserved hypothetical protein [Chlamydia caviae GPIC]